MSKTTCSDNLRLIIVSKVLSAVLDLSRKNQVLWMRLYYEMRSTNKSTFSRNVCL